MSRLKFCLRDQSDDISMIPKVTMADGRRVGVGDVKWSHESEPEGKLEGLFKGELISCQWADFEK